MRVLLDVDGVLGDFPSCALRFCNLAGRPAGGPIYSPDMVNQHDILKALELKHLQERFDVWCAETAVCKEIPVYEGAQDFVKKLSDLAEVIIVTSSYEAVPGWEYHRREWLKRHFGIDKRDVVFCKRKELVRGHVLIDDKADNCEAFAGSAQFRDAIVFDRPWNRGSKLPRARSYADALEMVGKKVAA